MAWGEVPRDDYAGIDSAELREQVVVVRKSRERLLAHQAGKGGGGQPPELSKPGWASVAAGLVLLAGGLALAGWWFFYPDLVFQTLGERESPRRLRSAPRSSSAAAGW